MPIFSIAPLSPLTPSVPLNRADQAVEALARLAAVQSVEVLGAMIDQSHSQPQSDLANLAKNAVGEGEVSRAKAGEVDAVATDPEAQVEAPARAVAAAAGRAAARQAGLAPLMADMAQAAADPETPSPVRAAIAQVMRLSTRMDAQIKGAEVRQALQRSGLFLEARLAADPTSRQRAGALPAPTPNNDMKAALLVFREVVKTWTETIPPTSAQVGGAASVPSSATPNAAPNLASNTAPGVASPLAVQSPAPDLEPSAAFTAPAALAPSADVETPGIFSSTAGPATGPAIDPAASEPEASPASRPTADDGAPEMAKPTWPNVNTPRQAAPPVAAQAQQQAPLPAFGAIVAEDFAPALATALPAAPAPGVASAAVAAYGGAEAPPVPPDRTPPPYAGAPTHAQAAAQPGLPANAGPHAVAHRLLAETSAALARAELLQIASLPEPPVAGRPVEEHGQRWVFDMPFMTPQGPAAAQFEISRDGGGSGGEGGREMGRTWRARFSLDVEPMGPVHVQVALTGDRARVSLWAERPAAMARLRTGEERLGGALRDAALEPEIAFHTGQPRAPAAAPGQFLDQAT